MPAIRIPILTCAGFWLAFALAAVPAQAQVRWLGSTEIAAGRGEKGPWQQNASRYDYVDDPTVVFDAGGDAAVAWVDQKRKEVLVQRRSFADGRPLSDPVVVSRSPGSFSWLPRMARVPDAPQRLHIVWQEIIFSGGSHGGDILHAHSDDGGTTFSPPRNISRSVGGDGKGRINPKVWHNGSLDVAAGPGGRLAVAWTEFDGALWLAQSRDGGGTFARPQRIASGGKPARAPTVVFGKDGAVILAWTTGDDDDADIHVARSVGDGFTPPEKVGAGRGYADAPKLAVGANGTVHLVYAQSDGGPFGRYRILHARTEEGRGFGTPRDIAGSLPGGAESAAFPSLAADAGGRLLVAYELFPDRRRRSRGLGLSVSLDGGRSFAPPSVVPGSADPAGGTNGSHQGQLMEKLAIDAGGNVAIVNSSLLPDTGSRVWLMRGTIAASTGGSR